MGHMHPENLSKLAIKLIYAKGKASIYDMVEHAKKKGEVVSCSEGTYSDDGMYAMAFEYIVSFHYNSLWNNPKAYAIGIQTIEPVIETDEDRKNFNKWKNDRFELEEEWEHHANIKWRFVNGARKRYLNGEIKHLTSITN